MTAAPNHIPPKDQRLERINLVLIYLNSLLFSGLFSFDSLPVFLVRAAFNGSGIIMVIGLLSLLIGNIIARIKTGHHRFAAMGVYYSSTCLAVLQAIFTLAISAMLLLR